MTKITAKKFQEMIKSGQIESTGKGLISNNFEIEKTTPKGTGNNFKKSWSLENKKIKQAKKVNINLQPITMPIPEWKKKHPGEIYFDSLLEGQFYHFLKKYGIKFYLKPKVNVLGTFKYFTETQRAVTWNPDFFIVTNPNPTIIDTKGYPNDAFPMKLKFIMHYLYHKYGNDKMPHVWFIKTKKHFPIALNAINRLIKGEDLNGIEKPLLFENQRPKKKKK